MTEREGVQEAGSRVYDVKDHPLDPPAAPAVSLPTAEGHHRPDDRSDEGQETVWVFWVLGLLGLALILFIGLMVVLNLTIF